MSRCSLLFSHHRDIRSGSKDLLVGRLPLKGEMGNDFLDPPSAASVRLPADC
jgi:hypothetical protein